MAAFTTSPGMIYISDMVISAVGTEKKEKVDDTIWHFGQHQLSGEDTATIALMEEIVYEDSVY